MAVKKTLEALSSRLLDLDRAIEERNSSRCRKIFGPETYEFMESTKNPNTQMKTDFGLKKNPLVVGKRLGGEKSRKHPLK